MKKMRAELAAQLLHPEHAVLSDNSNVIVPWQCPDDPRHVWEAAPNARRTLACPVCLNKTVLPDVNDLATTHPELAAQLIDQTQAQEVHAGSHKKLDWTCGRPKHIWLTSVVSRTRLGSGCPYCSGRNVVVGVNDLATTHPDIAAQLVDPTLAKTIGQGSSKKLAWQCQQDSSHTWEAQVRNRVQKSTGCPHCLGRTNRLAARHGTVAALHPELLSQAVNPSQIEDLSIGSGKTVEWNCTTCATAHIYRMTVRHKLRGQGCPVAAGVQIMLGINDLATTHPDIAAQLVDQSRTSALSKGSTSMETWRCTEGHQWDAAPYTRVSGNGCPVCANKKVIKGVNDLATTNPDVAAMLVDQDLAEQLTSGSSKIVELNCPTDSRHVWEARVASVTGGASCPVCANKKVMSGINDMATTHPDVAAQLLDPQVATTLTVSSARRVTWQCTDDPTHVWETFAYQRAHDLTGCPRCSASAPEKDLLQVIRSLVPDEQIKTGDRSTLAGKELDIVIPSKNLAMEFNGLYWHSEANGKDKNYHLRKSRTAATAQLQLLHIWEDDWRNSRDVVIRAIAHRLGATAHLLDVLPDLDPKACQKAAARSLELTEVTGQQAAAFLSSNHIQGPVSATRHFALQDGDGDLRALLSLRSPRSSARMKRAEGVWEIQRYATCGIVPGGFTKLLKHAEQTLKKEGVQLEQWISFAANDISDGGLYELAGFVADGELRPDYKYVGAFTGWNRSPKEGFQKRRFRDDPALSWKEGWTEHEAALANGLFRIYDAGKTRWVKHV